MGRHGRPGRPERAGRRGRAHHRPPRGAEGSHRRRAAPLCMHSSPTLPSRSMTVEVHDALLPTLNFDGADPYEVRGTPFEARAPAPHPPDHLLTHAAAVRSMEHSFRRAARRPDDESASGAGESAPSAPPPDGSSVSARALPATICEPRTKTDSGAYSARRPSARRSASRATLMPRSGAGDPEAGAIRPGARWPGPVSSAAGSLHHLLTPWPAVCHGARAAARTNTSSITLRRAHSRLH